MGGLILALMTRLLPVRSSLQDNGMALDLELVTSDKGLKAVLKEESIPYFDPSDPIA